MWAVSETFFGMCIALIVTTQIRGNVDLGYALKKAMCSRYIGQVVDGGAGGEIIG